ncbi:phage holin family protein [Ornithinimicrobium cryptoxanthini]|uniref:Phage holin family protein n=1 Tax=Ornithinimicrobium cryptoxanthini TaxID=2934161 RepID=A0ABY4YIC7_9MICO|nr:phage holin family protein [Ornithinimicrobium cryptoxanthini]USQ76516.1 phage holin family protein [Ornithinimicrobium cryptoxanthini]
MSFLIKVLVNGVALWVAALLVDGIVFEEASSTTAQVLTIAAVALIFGVLNAVIKPILTILSLPVLILTLGLFTFILNAIMLWLTQWVAAWFDLGFDVQSFWWDAVLGALIITIVSMVLNAVLPDGRD